jgi:CRISPR-associated protein Cas2
MTEEHLYVVTYDIADEKRWRAVFKLMHGYGEWLQLSVFQCRLPRSRYIEFVAKLETAISRTEDSVLIIDIGVADSVSPRLQSFGKRVFVPVERKPIIV